MIGSPGFWQESAAYDYILADGETLSLDSFSRTDNFVGPTEEGASATLYLNNSIEISEYTGNITGNITIYRTGRGNLRTYNTYSDTVPFTGDFYHQGGNVYLSTGKELGTGTIYLESGGHLVNEGNRKRDGSFTRNCVIENNIVLSGTGNRVIRAGWNIANGGATMTLNGIISGDQLLCYQAGESTPATIYINGANTYTGGTRLECANIAETSLVDHALYVLGHNSAFGTGTVTTINNKVVVDVSRAPSLANSFTLNANETILRNSGAEAVVLGAHANERTAWVVSDGKTLIFQNTGTGSLTLGKNTATEGWILTGNGTIKFEDSATVYLETRDTSISITGPTDERKKLSLTFQHGVLWGRTYYGKLSGNMDLHIQQSTRFINASSDFTGMIDTNSNIYFAYGSEMGNKKSNIITMSAGHIVNQGRSNPIVPNDIVTTGEGNIIFRAGWNTTEYAGGDRSSLTLTGDISGTKGVVYGSETNAGAIYLQGNNSYLGNTTIAYGYNASASANHRCWFGIGSDTAFSTGTVTVNTDIPTTVFNLETDTDTTRTLNNSIIVTKNTLQFANGGTGDGVINSNITGASTNAIEFGSDKAAENVGKLFFHGETTKNAVVNPSATLGGTGTVGNLEIQKDATLYLSSLLNGNAESAFTADGILTLDGTIQVDLDATISTDALLLNVSSTVLGDDASFLFHNLTPVEAGTEFSILGLGSGITAEDLLGRITVSGAGSGWTYALHEDGVLSLTMNVPEPGTWAMLLLGLGFLFFWKKRVAS